MSEASSAAIAGDAQRFLMPAINRLTNSIFAKFGTDWLTAMNCVTVGKSSRACPPMG